jgi:predicted Zn-dependent protease with MMP-like domain
VTAPSLSGGDLKYRSDLRARWALTKGPSAPLSALALFKCERGSIRTLQCVLVGAIHSDRCFQVPSWERPIITLVDRQEVAMIESMITISVAQFEGLVANALDGIPADLGAAMENVAVIVDHQSPPGRLLGLYEGIPLTSRGAHYSATTPDRITIYMAAVCEMCQTADDVVGLVQKVVVHEVGHHFGIDDSRLEELGWG